MTRSTEKVSIDVRVDFPFDRHDRIDAHSVMWRHKRKWNGVAMQWSLAQQSEENEYRKMRFAWFT